MLKNLTQTFRELGLFGGTIYLADRTFERTMSRRVFYYYSILAQPVVPPRLRRRRGQDTTVIKTIADLHACSFELAPEPDLAEQRINAGYRCIVLHKERELTAYAWLALHGFDEDEVRCRFVPLPADSTGWDFDVFVEPDKRGTFAFVQLWDEINAYYSEQQREKTFSRVSRFNLSSIKSHASLGAVTVASVLFIVIGKLQFMFANQRPFVHVSLSSRPTLRFKQL